MIVITILDPDAHTVTAHPYMPVAPVNARAVSCELSRDFPDAVVTARQLTTGTVVCQYRGGRIAR